MAYEVATFRALREMLRCQEIWVVGVGRYRNPDEDLPGDCEARRVDYYRQLRTPLDPAVFCGSLRAEMTAALDELHDALPDLAWEVSRRWQAVPLIDLLKEALLRIGVLDQVASVAGSSLRPEVLAERLMLAIYGYGTNTGIRLLAPARRPTNGYLVAGAPRPGSGQAAGAGPGSWAVAVACATVGGPAGPDGRYRDRRRRARRWLSSCSLPAAADCARRPNLVRPVRLVGAWSPADWIRAEARDVIGVWRLPEAGATGIRPEAAMAIMRRGVTRR